jgi:glucosamine-6-phosphate deaminase
MSRKAAAAVADVVRRKPKAVLGFATGSSPLGLYKELIRLHKEEGLDFSKVTTFNLDEYVSLAPDHPQSYWRFMHENLFGHINVPKKNVHVPSGTSKDHAAFCAQYEKWIKEAGGIDAQILGIGSDGHIAFNEPGSSLGSRTRMVTLTEQTIDDNARFFQKRQDVPRHAISMGVGTVLDARKLVMVVNGKSKAPALAAAIEGPVTCMITASALQLHPDPIVFADEEAAGQLKMTDYYRWIQKNKPAVQ